MKDPMGGNLDRLHLRFEGPREDAFNEPTEPSLEALEYSHGPSSPQGSTPIARTMARSAERHVNDVRHR